MKQDEDEDDDLFRFIQQSQAASSPSLYNNSLSAY